jgi:hypothetical protein
MTEFWSMLQNEAMKYTVNNQQKPDKQGGFMMFLRSFFSLSQSSAPFFIFLFSYFLGACEPSDGAASRGVFGAQFTVNLVRNLCKLGAKSGVKLGHNLVPQPATDDKNDPNDCG